MLYEIIILIILTLIPALELRASIPYGILVLHMNWILVFVVCVIANILLGIVLYPFLDKFIRLFLRFKIIDKAYQKYVEKTQKKIHKYVEKYGEIGIALFIGVPLPGTGVYTAALGSYLLGLDFKKFIIATVLGVLIAGIAVLAVTMTGSEIFRFFIKVV